MAVAIWFAIHINHAFRIGVFQSVFDIDYGKWALVFYSCIQRCLAKYLSFRSLYVSVAIRVGDAVEFLEMVNNLFCAGTEWVASAPW